MRNGAVGLIEKSVKHRYGPAAVMGSNSKDVTEKIFLGRLEK